MNEKNQKISLIIPAHNEEENLGRVLAAAVKVPEVNEILVVADACNDKTVEVAKSYGVKILIRANTNGKGDAMFDGFNHVSGEIIMFADADLENLTVAHIQKVLRPIISGEAAMSVGLRDRIFGLSAVIPRAFPMYAIGGERAMTRDFFNLIPRNKNTLDFGIETVMNFYAKKHGLRVAYPILKNLHQVIKEKKWGFWKGLFSRFGLCWQVWRARFNMKHKNDL